MRQHLVRYALKWRSGDALPVVIGPAPHRLTMAVCSILNNADYR